MLESHTVLAIIALSIMIASLGVTKQISEKSGKEALDLLNKKQVILTFAIIVEIGVVYSSYVQGNTPIAVMWGVNILLAMLTWHTVEKQKNMQLSLID